MRRLYNKMQARRQSIRRNDKLRVEAVECIAANIFNWINNYTFLTFLRLLYMVASPLLPLDKRSNKMSY